MFRDTPRLIRCLMLLGAALAIGCGDSTTAPATDASSASAPALPAVPPAIPDLGAALAKPQSQPGGEASQPAADASAEPVASHETTDQPETTDSRDAQTTPPVEEDRQVAVAGVGRKGKNYGGGIISTPVSAYFGARERIAFIAVTDAMRKFNAEHDRDPESHEEFMEQIINANNIELPALYEHQRYEYDPETGELMVVGPKK